MVAGTNSGYSNKVKANIETGFTSCLCFVLALDILFF